jgi:hypothetical protein
MKKGAVKRCAKVEAEQKHPVSIFRHDITRGEEVTHFYTSDIHFDSVYCNREVLTEHLDEAKRKGALIFIFGDFFDAMQGRFDPRRDMDELRPEYRRNDYYDFVVRDAADFLEPYANNIALISDGNHELAVLKNSNTHLIDRLVEKLRHRCPSSIVQHGGYGGWIINQFKRGNYGATKRVKYFHGSGGEAPVTRGVIQTNRQAVYLPDADIVVNGHSHNSYHVPIVREKVNQAGIVYFDTQHHIRTPGYKQSYGDGSQGWDVTRGGVPKPLGGAWVTFSEKADSVQMRQGVRRVKYENPRSSRGFCLGSYRSIPTVI